MGLDKVTIARVAIAVALTLAAAPLPLSAQTLGDSITAKARPGGDKDKLLVEAGQIDYDNDKNTVSAVGDVHLYYQGRVLQADRVTYDRNSKRVFATGNARLTEQDGTVATGDRFELTDDFKDGFIDSLRVKQTTTVQGTPVTVRFSSPRGERTSGETTVFEKGTYTACEPCAENPEKPPLWQVRAAKIIHNNAERMIYYEDATIEFAGIPVAYIPYFSAPDPTVKRKTGFLTPNYIASTALGYGASVPFFWNMAPNYDLTVTPSFLSRQGVLGVAEWRHRLLNGSYNIRASGIFQQDASAFLPAPLGAQNKDFRGSIETAGRFFINDRWQWGWDIAAISDKWFLQNYRIKSESLSSIYFKESTSTLFLTGKSDTAFFDLRGYYFKGLSYADWQKQQPLVHPVLDYNKRFHGPSLIGGEVAIDANVTSLSRDEAFFQQVPTPMRTLFGFYDTCTLFQKGQCILRGVAGTYSRASTEVSWQRNFTDPLGQVWTPFASLRVDGTWYQANTSSALNQFIPNFIDTNDEFLWRAMPAVGLEYRYPFVNVTNGLGTHTVEPIAQLIVRPNEQRIGDIPNEDAQSLIFDDTTIFERNKFSGYDRVEGGIRANYGAKYSVTTDAGYGDVLFGQSYQVAGLNSFEGGDVANTGLDSGLDNPASDYVGRVHLAPTQSLAFTARSRFDERTFGMKRLELQTTAVFGPLSTNVVFARYAAQPAIAVPEQRQGVYGSATFSLTPNWSVLGSAVFDLSRQDQRDGDSFLLNPSQTFVRTPLWSVAGASLGLQYRDECTIFSVAYTSSFNDPATGVRERDQTVLVRLELLTLGKADLKQSLLGGGSGGDGIAE